MKSLRNIKLRTFCPTAVDLVLAQNHNPLKQQIPVQPSHLSTVKCLNDFKTPFDFQQTSREPLVA
jgi:proteasome activator subunit 4